MRCSPAGVLAALLGLSLVSEALAQPAAPTACGPVSVGNSAVAVTFPAAGKNGPPSPSQYLTLVNPDAANTCWVNAQPGGTAAANAAGSIPLNPLGGSISWAVGLGYPPPAALSIICPAGATAVTCNYR